MASHKITLYGFPKKNNAPSASGFCQKLETFLRATGLTNYEHQATLPSQAPKKKLPYIDLVTTPTSSSTPDDTNNKVATPPATTTIADSQLIIQHLVSSGVCKDLDAPLTPAQRADSRAWIAYTEELFYTALVTTRWYWDREDNYAANYSTLPIPWTVKPLAAWWLRRRINDTMWRMGVGRHSKEDVDGILRQWMDGVEAKLEAGSSEARKEGEWWFGKEDPTLVDIVVYGFLANLIGVGEGNREALEMVKERKAIREFVRRGTERWFPEYDGVLEFVR